MIRSFSKDAIRAEIKEKLGYEEASWTNLFVPDFVELHNELEGFRWGYSDDYSNVIFFSESSVFTCGEPCPGCRAGDVHCITVHLPYKHDEEYQFVCLDPTMKE